MTDTPTTSDDPREAAFEASEPFHGTVSLVDWEQTPTGPYKGFTGSVSVMPATALVPGWEPGGRDATWLATVEGESSTVFVFGCQIHTIQRHAADVAVTNQNVLVVP